MNRYRKKFLKYAVIVPVAVGIIIAIAVLIATNSVLKNFIVPSTSFSFSSFSTDEAVSKAESVSVKGNLKKSDLKAIKSDVEFGKLTIDSSKSIPIIFDANPINAVGRLNLIQNSKLIGETGTASLSCYKADMTSFSKIKVGQSITADLCYGSYTLELVKKKSVTNANAANKLAAGIESAVVIYGDDSDGVGIANNLKVYVFKITSGIHVAD